jgi:predicted ATPase
VILTPDQRLRVFVSSTLQELAPERAAVSRAIESLRLIPVMFEMGARPHPPRDLYRAYLDQSHIFVGIYWERYGWVAPEMDVSGLEDEYLLSGDRPKLMYLKRTSGAREERLEDMLRRILDDSHAMVREFDTPEELESIVKDDLVVMLTERFETRSPDVPSEPARSRMAALPVDLNPLIGRDDEVEEIVALLEGGARLVTLTGPGGVGKTRLAAAVARAVAGRFEDGLFYVALSPVSDPNLVATSVAQAAGLKLSSGEEPVASLVEFLAGRQILLVIDNFEHLMPAADVISELLTQSPRIQILLTSRELLRVRGEHDFPVAPLEMPVEGSAPSVTQKAEAVRLFVDRARGVRPDLELDDDDHAAVAQITRLLDGLPLAIELAAARMRVLSPQTLLEKLTTGVSFLSSGSRDMPERHQTLRATIEWSHDLLGLNEKALFSRLGVFPGTFTLEAVEAICGKSGDVLEDFASLLDKSMVRADVEAGVEPRFMMLRTIQEFAVELLSDSGELEELREAHARYFLDLALRAGDGLRSADQRRWTHQMEVEVANHRVAMEWALEVGEIGLVSQVGWAVWLFWWAGGYLEEGRRWMERALSSADLDQTARARALAVFGVMAFWQGDLAAALPAQVESLGMFEVVNDPDGVALTGLVVGLATALMGDVDGGRARLRASRAHLAGTADRWGAVMALNSLLWLQELLGDTERDEEEYATLLAEAQAVGADIEVSNALANNGYYWNFRGDLPKAASYLSRSLEVLQALRNKGSAWYILDRTAEITMKLGDPERAARVLGASDAMKQQINAMPVATAFEKLEELRAALIAEIGQEAFERAYAAGAEMGFDEALAYARAGVPATAP